MWQILVPRPQALVTPLSGVEHVIPRSAEESRVNQKTLDLQCRFQAVLDCNPDPSADLGMTWERVLRQFVHSSRLTNHCPNRFRHPVDVCRGEPRDVDAA
jgi:hypothetical protein